MKDGREERLAAFDLEMRLRRNPEVTARREAYWTARKAAKAHAETMTRAELVDALITHNPAYIRSLLESEDDRFGAGALADRYAATFYTEFRP